MPTASNVCYLSILHSYFKGPVVLNYAEYEDSLNINERALFSTNNNINSTGFHKVETNFFFEIKNC